VIPPQSSRLTWQCVQGTAKSCRISGVGPVCSTPNTCTTGSLRVSPRVNTTYTLSCDANNDPASPYTMFSETMVKVRGPRVIETSSLDVL
jgi:hypothetical protein